MLLCRALLDLMNAPPSTAACGVDEVPLHVEWRWATKGGLVFEATTLAHRSDVPAIAMAAPPPGRSFAAPSLPQSGAAPFVDQGDLIAFRTAPAEVPSLPAPASRSLPLPRALDASAPSGLTLANGSDEMRIAWLDGAPVAWIAPGGTVAFPSLFRGRYGFAWRTFLGDAYDAPITITVPSALSLSAGDAGAP